MSNRIDHSATRCAVERTTNHLAANDRLGYATSSYSAAASTASARGDAPAASRAGCSKIPRGKPVTAADHRCRPAKIGGLHRGRI